MKYNVVKDSRLVQGMKPTRVVSLTRNGMYTMVEVWANDIRFSVTLDRYFNVVLIKRFTLEKGSRPWNQFYHWQTDFHRNYKRKAPFMPLHTDIVCMALEHARTQKALLKTT